MTRILDVAVAVATGPLGWPSLLAGVIGVLLVRQTRRGQAGQAVALATATVAVVVMDSAPWLLLGAALVAAADAVPQPSSGRGSVQGAAAAGRVAEVLLAAAGVWVVLVQAGLYPGRWHLLAGFLAVVLVPLLLRVPRPDDAVSGLLLPISLVGIYACVPDTEFAIIAMLSAVPVVVLGGAAISGAHSWPLVLLMAASGGVPRTASLVGAIGCLGVLLVPTTHRVPRWAVLASHVVLVAVASRVAGLGTDTTRAVVIVAAATAVAAFVLAGRLGATRRP